MRGAIALLLGVVTVAFGASVTPHGETLVSAHIIGGNPQSFQDVPYSIRLRLSSSPSGEPTRYCGAVRLHRDTKYRDWFVTAAECLDNEKYEVLEMSYPGQDGAIIKRLINIKYNPQVIHPKYNRDTKENNIGLIKCIYPCADVDANLLPELTEKDSFARSKPIVTGWTITNATAEMQAVDEITSYETTVVNSFLCKLVYFFRSVTNEHICTSTWGKKRITEAHVGVPLVVKEGTEENSRLILIGIASSVRPWTTKLIIPTVFTSIPKHAEWINQVTGIPIQN